jgi:hypothetical protein
LPGRAVLVLLALGGLSACSADCFNGDRGHCADPHTLSRCEGSVDAVGQSHHRVTIACRGINAVCMEPRDRPALCGISRTPAPECAGGSGELCRGNSRASCTMGFLSVTEVCSDQCLSNTVASGATCTACSSAPTTPEPRCNSAVNSVCDGNAVRICACELALAPTPCDGGTVCVGANRDGLHVATEAFCALSSQPDARCQGTGIRVICDGATLLRCQDGFLVATTRCSGTCAVDSNGQPRCQP